MCGNNDKEEHNHSHHHGFSTGDLDLTCAACKQLNRDQNSSPESTSELDSGISVNANYDDPTRWKNGSENSKRLNDILDEPDKG